MVSNKTAITPTELADYIISKFRNFEQNLKDLKQKLINNSTKRLERELQTLNQYKQILQILDPKNLLKRGYSITYLDDKIIKSASQLIKGDQITTLFADSKAVSLVNDIEN